MLIVGATHSGTTLLVLFFFLLLLVFCFVFFLLLCVCNTSALSKLLSSHPNLFRSQCSVCLFCIPSSILLECLLLVSSFFEGFLSSVQNRNRVF